MSRIDRERYNMLRERSEIFFEGLSVQERAIMLSMAQSEFKRESAKQASDKEQYLTWDIANSAYVFILEDNISAKEALTKAADKHKTELERVLSEKSKYSGGLSGTIVKTNDIHPVQKDMNKEGKFNRQSIKNSKNVWQMLNLLKDFRQAYEDLCNLKDALKRINRLEGTTYLMQAEIDSLKNLAGLASLTDQQKANIMLKEGFSKKTIADVLGKTERTIRTWTN